MTETLTLAVPDMDCPTCAGKVEGALSRTPGVRAVETRPTMGRVEVEFDGADPEAVIAAIEAAGYEVVDGADDGERVSRAPVWRTRRALLTTIGAVLAALGGLLALVIDGGSTVYGSVGLLEFTPAKLAFLAATLVAGTAVVRDGAYSLRQRNLDIDLLMSIAIVAAVVAGMPFEAAMLAVLFSIAELLERHAMDQARSSVTELMDLSPTVATRRHPDGTEETIPVEALSVEETVAVRPGERIPIDGTVVEGASAIDQSPITGESVPVDVSPGDEVYAGTINEAGYLEVRVDTPPGDSTLDRIIELVEDAETGRTEHERLVDRFASAYTPVVVVAALATVVVPPLVFGAAWETWFVRGLALLVIACPCAFVISTPVSVVSGVTSAARNGALIKGGRHLEAMADVETIAFDKTGTLTTGELSVTSVRGLEAEESSVLATAAALEANSSHPIADAVLERADEADATAPAATDFERHAGRGVAADLDGTRTYIGSPRLFRELGFDLDGLRYRTDGGRCQATGPTCEHPSCENLAADIIGELQASGQTVLLVGTEVQLLGIIAVSDAIRPEAASTIETLHDRGVRTVLLTGDNEGVARAVAAEVGIDEVHAALLPDEKLELIADIEADRGAVAMVGDGVNDAPALTAATVGIAMGAAGSDAAIEAGDMALMGDDLGHVPYLHRLSQTARRVIRQNIIASLGVKAVLAAGAPIGIVTVVHAVLVGDMGMSLGVTGNAMRLARVRP